jgi:hypothetical protein
MNETFGSTREALRFLKRRTVPRRDVVWCCTSCGARRDIDDCDAPCGVCGGQTASTAVVKGTTRLTRRVVRGAREQDKGRAPKETA